METLLVFAVAELALATTVNTLHLQAQEKILEKWRQGKLSAEELNILKTRLWFQRRVLSPPPKPVPESKKTD